jgi:hypothetical protein
MLITLKSFPLVGLKPIQLIRTCSIDNGQSCRGIFSFQEMGVGEVRVAYACAMYD